MSMCVYKSANKKDRSGQNKWEKIKRMHIYIHIYSIVYIYTFLLLLGKSVATGNSFLKTNYARPHVCTVYIETNIYLFQTLYRDDYNPV